MSRSLRSALIGATALCGLLAAQAHAADVLGKAPPYIPTAPYADWSGLSAFGTVGYGWFTGNTAIGAADNIPGGGQQFINFAGTVGLPLGFGFSDGAVQGGFGIGFDKQYGPIIGGIYTDWVFTGATASNGAAVAFDNIGDTVGIHTQTKLQGYGTTQLEAGYQFNQQVPLAAFVHGGWAYGQIEHTDGFFASGPLVNLGGGPFATQYRTSSLQFGPVVGAKIEYMITRQWIAAVDYEHVFFQSLDTNVPFLNGVSGVSHTDLALDSVRFNVKYLLNIP